MKYSYAYKISDGSRHEATMEAESREAVFKALREKGIRAIKVVAEDGSKANGETRGVRVRAVVLAVVLTAVIAGVVVGLVVRNKNDEVPFKVPVQNETRHQLIGDMAVIEKGIRTGWAEVFPEEGERFFASFAIPGVKAGQRNTTVEELSSALQRTIEVSADDGLEAVQIKAMVEGMKEEARRYIAAGGSVVEYGKRLTERQDAEIAIYERTKLEIEKAKNTMDEQELFKFWELRNDQLRNLGIKLIPLE